VSSYNGGVVVKVLTIGSFQSNQVLPVASDEFKFLTNKGVISSAIASAIIAGIGLVFFALFIWKRKTLDPPSYIDIEKANKPDEKGSTTGLGEFSPELPIQPVEKTSFSPNGSDDLFAGYVPYAHYHESSAEQARGHSRNGSNASSMTANNSAYSLYRETLQKKALSTNSISSTDSTCRDLVSNYDPTDLGCARPGSRGKSVGSISSLYSDESQYSQTSERIIINNVRMPPQFSTPIRPPSVVSRKCLL
jgi:hypothetical protein